jgi:hypothetical protein
MLRLREAMETTACNSALARGNFANIALRLIVYCSLAQACSKFAYSSSTSWLDRLTSAKRTGMQAS